MSMDRDRDRDEDETPTRLLPAMPHPSAPTDTQLQALLTALQAVIAELKGISQKVNRIDAAVNNHVTDIAVMKVQSTAYEQLTGSRFATLAASQAALDTRVGSLENERNELARNILAKAATMCGIIIAVACVVFAYFKVKAGGGP